MKKTKLLTGLCGMAGIAGTIMPLASCSCSNPLQGNLIECMTSREVAVDGKTKASIKFKYHGETYGIKIKAKIDTELKHDIVMTTSAEVQRDWTFTLELDFKEQPEEGWDEIFTIVFTYEDEGKQYTQRMTGVRLFYQEILVGNNVTLVGESQRTITGGTEIKYDFVLDHPLQGEEIVACEAADIIGTNSLTIEIAEKAEIGQDQTEFSLKATVYKENGGEPYDKDNVIFKLIFTGSKKEEQTFQSEIPGMKVTYDIENNNVPLENLVIENGIFKGFVAGTDLSKYDTLFIPNSVVETSPLTLSKQSTLKTIKFEEGKYPLYIANNFLPGLYNVETLVLPKRLSYIGTNSLRNLQDLETIDISSWDQEKFDTSNPFGESYNFSDNVPTKGTFKLASDNSIAKDAYYAFTGLNSNFKGWSNLEQPSKQGQKKEGFIYDVFDDGTEIITGTDGTWSSEALTIPTWCTAIGTNAFYNASAGTTKISNVKTVTVSENSKLQKIYGGAFARSNIESVDLSKAKSLEYIDNGVFFDSDSLTNVIFPEQLKGISTNCFNNCGKLGSIDLSKTQIEKIPIATFSNCTTLQEVTLNSKINWIGANAFNNCVNLKSKFDLSTNLNFVGSNAFNGCKNAVIILPTKDESTVLSYIGDKAFYNAGITGSIYIPSSVLYVGDGAFGFNNGITDIKVSEANKKYFASNGYLYNKDNELVFACAQGGEIPTNIEVIRPYAAAGNTYLGGNTLDLSKTSITTIGEYAFYQTKSTSDNGYEIVLPDTVKYIGEYAFANSEVSNVNLESLVNLQSSGEYLFNQCQKLTEVTIPYGIVTVPVGCFAWSSVESVIIKGSVNTMNVYAFQGCKLKTLDVSDFDAPPTNWVQSSMLNLTTFPGSSSITVYIKSMDLKEEWQEVLEKAVGSSSTTVPTFNFQLKI